MNSKFTVLAGSAAALVAALPASAQANCEVYEKVVSAYADSFRTIVGDKTDSTAERDSFKTTVVIPGAGDCGVYETINWRLYQCHREFEFERDARAAGSASSAEISGCLAAWQRRDFPVPATGYGFAPLAHTRYVDSSNPKHPSFEIDLGRRNDANGNGTFVLDINLVSRRERTAG